MARPEPRRPKPAANPAHAVDDPTTLEARHLALIERLRADEERLRGLARSVWRIQEDERRRIARELHDGIGQNLTALKHAIAMIGTEAGPALRERVDRALSLCSRTLHETRALSRLLRPQILDELGLQPALEWLVRTMAADAQAQVELEYRVESEPDAESSTVLFRVAQEGLGNALRHAAAANIVLRLVGDQDALELLVWDDGQGCDAGQAWEAGRQGRSGGLGGMRERARLLGGELEFESAPGSGSRLVCRLPGPRPTAGRESP